MKCLKNEAIEAIYYYYKIYYIPYIKPHSTSFNIVLHYWSNDVLMMFGICWMKISKNAINQIQHLQTSDNIYRIVFN